MSALIDLMLPLLRRLPPETAHRLSLRALRLGVAPRRARPDPPSLAITLWGRSFPNPVGLAAGFDKNAEVPQEMLRFGFGFVEIGTVTPRPQAGNPRPRLFRAPRARAIVNRMGFPSIGAQAVAQRLAVWRRTLVCGINIGKNAATPVSSAADDYLAALAAVYDCADYVAVNISSPNTAGLRELEQPARLEPLLVALLELRARLASRTGRRVPLLPKLSPDLSDADLEATAGMLRRLQIDGVIATNSTVQLDNAARGSEAGGLSGPPLAPLAMRTVARLRALLGPRFPIIGVGGIDSLEAGRAMRAAGADLIQIYTGLVYRGPGLVRELAQL